MPTLRDVAKDAGVSIATVSYCLSGKKPVKYETRMRVMDSIEKLKYIPNRSARNLKNFTSNLIGVILTDIDNTYHAEIFKGISAQLQVHNYTVSVAFSNNSPDVECQKIEDFISQNVEGLILITCQPYNTDFFQKTILNYQIAAVFIEQAPRHLPVNFASFDNFQTARYLTDSLIEKGYRKIALVCGPDSFSSETDSARGYRESLEQANIHLKKSLICHTDMSKEHAFKTVLTQLCSQQPEAVIATSENIALGAVEALNTYGIRVPDNVTVITYGEESWNSSSHREGLIHTNRPAFSLGSRAGELLIKNIENPLSFTPKSITLTDPVVGDSLEIRARQELPAPSMLFSRDTPGLHILLVDLPTARSARLLSRHFTRNTGIPVDFEFCPQDSLLTKISDMIEGETKNYDIFMYDIPWLSYMVQNTFVSDISDFVESGDFDSGRLFRTNLESCRFEGKYYGIPLVGGAQILFYRRDLFEDRRLLRAYKDKYRISLRPPRTWTEYNGIAEFFTRKYNPASPTEYGTSFAGITDEELAPEILIRLWACGGRLWDNYNRPCLNTPENVRAFESILKSLRYTKGNPFETSISQTVEDFSNGNSSMLITYTEYAAQISQSLRKNIIGRVGYEMVPGRRPANVGWNMGLNPFSPNRKLAYEYFKWIIRKDTSFYMTILDGQSPAVAPYHSQELLRLYPWMSITEKSFPYVQKRTGPYKNNTLIIPQNKIEAILCNVLHLILEDNLDIAKALEINQQKMKALFSLYGYPAPLR